MNFRGRYPSAGLWTLALLFWLAPTASAQLLQGSLDGNVVDASQAAIPGAAVTLTNEQTGASRRTETNAVGAYSFQTVDSGLWTLEVQAEGFQTYRETGVDIRPNAVARVNVALEVGQVTETVEVSATAATLQTDRAEVRQEVTETTLKNIPVPLGRNYQMLFITLPGFSPPQNAHSVPTNPSRAVSFSVNGTSRSNNNTRIDGASSTNIWVPHMTGYNPALESIEQVNVVTSSFDAEQGLAGGAAINLTIKSGTNDIHGSAFEYHTDQHIMAYPWESDRNADQPKFIYNQFGGTIGGPIAKNKWFYFLSYEGTYESRFAQRFVDVPRPEMKDGDLSHVFTGSGCADVDCNVYDPFTGNSRSGAGRQPFPNAQIPRSRFDPAAATIADMPEWPSPNRIGSGEWGLNNNYVAGGSTTFFRDTIDAKTNFHLSDKWSGFLRFSMLDYRMYNDQVFGDLGGSALHPTNSNPGTGFGNTFSGTASMTYVASPTLVFDGYFGYTVVDTNVEQRNLDKNIGWDLLGIPGLQSDRVIDGGWPRLRIDGFEQLGISNHFMPYYRTDPQAQYVLNGNWTKGSHNVRFGTDLYFQNLNHNQPEFSGSQGPSQGGFRFRNGTTRLNRSGAPDSRSTSFNGFGAFLTGVFQDAGKIWQFNEDGYHTRTSLYSFYVRDRWQITPRLTMSYGARYEVYPFPTRKERGLERYILDDTSGLGQPASPNSMVICGLGGYPTDCGINKGGAKVVPRLGLAWRATDSTVLRAGYGMTVDPFNWARPLRTNYPIMEVFNINPSSFTIGGTLREGLPVISEPDLSSGILPMPNSAAVTFFDNNNAVRGYIQSWNASLEKRFGSWIGTASYVGTRSNNQLAGLEQNWSPIGGGNAGRQLNNETFGNRTVTTELHGSLGTPKYDALQTKLQHRFSNGFQMNFAYTWAHTRAFTDEDSGDGARFFGIPSYYDRMYGSANQDIRHNFQFMGIYESPFGRGKSFLSDGGVLAAVLGGWQLNNLMSLYTGQPFTVTAPAGDLDAPGSSQVADCIAEPVKLGNQRDQGPMYDPAAFADPADFYGDSPRFGNCGINSVPGPGLFNLDLGLFRKFDLSERVELQFRAEAFNITNTPHFSNPEDSVTSGNFMLVDGIRNTGREGIDQRFFRFGLRLGW